MKNKSILIFGATGLLGMPVAMKLKEEGFTVRVFVRSKEKFDQAFGEGFEMAIGDVFDKTAVDEAMKDCSAVHISLSNLDDKAAAQIITETAGNHSIEKISLVTGSTVSKEHTWFWMMKQKYEAEQVVINSGIPYLIFKPSWFYDTLSRMVRNGRASVIGKQVKTFHWMAAADFATMVLNAYKNEKIINKALYCFGPEVYTLKEALEAYCKLAHPGIKKVTVAPVWLMKLIATLSGNKMLKMFTELSDYFTKVDEPPLDPETYQLLGKPETTMKEWVTMNK
jgi:uncharacterized protein YbjT (DUF2867 family)